LRAIPIAGRAGDLIIWHQALPHGATPNLCTLPRIVQYLNMFPSEHEINAEWI
jgi:ectoine hydroxylase-related dioxygenase (phytanoyl-CoA dioxygenase family)